MLATHLDEGLVGALHDALRADVDPRAGRHLAVHHQALAIEFVEVLPGRPVRHQVGVGDQHARRIDVGRETRRPACRTGSAGFRRRRVRAATSRIASIAFPVARGAADAAVDDELGRIFGDLGIEVVLQHAKRRFGQPAAAAEGIATGRPDLARSGRIGRIWTCGFLAPVKATLCQALSPPALGFLPHNRVQVTNRSMEMESCAGQLPCLSACWLRLSPCSHTANS